MLKTDVAAPTLLDVLRPDNLRDPYPFYRRLRDTIPIYWDEERGTWLLTRYADVIAALRDPRLSAERILPEQEAAEGATGLADGGVESPMARVMAKQMLFLDPPDHTRIRGLVSKAFTPRVIEGMRPSIQALIDELLDAVAARGRMDLIADFSFPLPAIVIAELLGVPAEDRDRFKEWSEAFGVLLDGGAHPPEEVEAAQAGVFTLIAYLMEIVEARREEPRDDLISLLIGAEEGGDTLDTEELLINCVLLLAAGHGMTTHMIGNGVLALLRHPAQLARLRDDPTLIGSAVNELLRYDGPVQVTGRQANQDLEIAGVRVARGQHVTTVLGAANHDPARFARPDGFDIGRQDNKHVAFAHGIHFCLGAALARLEGQLAIATLVRRFPALRLEIEEPERMPSIVFRGLTALPVALR